MITFQNTTFNSREINLTEFGNVLISTNRLNMSLMNESGSYISEEAMHIDELIFYFVEEDQAGSRYFCESLFWASQPKQAAKT